MSTAAVAIRPGEVLADLLPVVGASPARAKSRAWGRVRDIALVAGGAALTALSAQLSVPVPGSPVPVTGQTFAALLVGTALGARRGLLSLGLYAAVGAAGAPVFQGGTSGWGGASFGYVIGMLIAAGMVGALARRGGDRSVPRMAGTMVLGSAVIYAVGVPWLMAATGMSLSAALAAGVVPFLIGDALKAALAMGALPTAWKLVGRKG